MKTIYLFAIAVLLSCSNSKQQNSTESSPCDVFLGKWGGGWGGQANFTITKDGNGYFISGQLQSDHTLRSPLTCENGILKSGQLEFKYSPNNQQLFITGEGYSFYKISR